jgi:RecJ-like exonuclease
MTPALIRFNDDCDGISAGILVKKAIEEFVSQNEIPFQKGFLKNKQCNSAVYDSGEAAWDSDENSFPEYDKKPLLFLLDFGGNEESVEGLEAAGNVFEVVILDHHVFSENAKSKTSGFLNPLEFGGTSWHTAGLVAYEFAKALAGRKAEEWKEYAFYSLESDKSIFRKKESFKQALVLDYLASQGLSLDKYEKALHVDLQLHYLEAAGKISAAKGRALKKTRILEVKNAKLILADLDGIVAKREFPPKGKVLNEVQKHYGGEEEGKMVASVGFDSTAIQFRVSRALHAKGFKATKIIDSVKKEFGEEGISGGGHEQAAAMRFRKEISKAVFDKTVELCKKELEKIL